MQCPPRDSNRFTATSFIQGGKQSSSGDCDGRIGKSSHVARSWSGRARGFLTIASATRSPARWARPPGGAPRSELRSHRTYKARRRRASGITSSRVWPGAGARPEAGVRSEPCRDERKCDRAARGARAERSNERSRTIHSGAAVEHHDAIRPALGTILRPSGSATASASRRR